MEHTKKNTCNKGLTEVIQYDRDRPQSAVSKRYMSCTCREVQMLDEKCTVHPQVWDYAFMYSLNRAYKQKDKITV